MQWKTEKPTRCGYYWYRRDHVDRDVIIEVGPSGEVYRFGGGGEDEALPRVADMAGEFAGPLYPPGAIDISTHDKPDQWLPPRS